MPMRSHGARLLAPYIMVKSMKSSVFILTRVHYFAELRVLRLSLMTIKWWDHHILQTVFLVCDIILCGPGCTLRLPHRPCLLIDILVLEYTLINFIQSLNFMTQPHCRTCLVITLFWQRPLLDFRMFGEHRQQNAILLNLKVFNSVLRRKSTLYNHRRFCLFSGRLC